jgi:hypothetical protein
MPISATSQWLEAYCCTQQRFPAGNVEKLSAMNVNWLSAVSSVQQVPNEYG